MIETRRSRRYFYPRPPGGGRLISSILPSRSANISIHALRVEGDLKISRLKVTSSNFYPRPPGGGRQTGAATCCAVPSFLSTPSGWRATRGAPRRPGAWARHFYPRPPGGGRLTFFAAIHKAHDFYPRPPGGGRRLTYTLCSAAGGFLSTPSGWRATPIIENAGRTPIISIHALRVEGDFRPPPA